MPADRTELAALQGALVASLVAGEAPPAGFGLDGLAAAREALRRKRVREAAQAWRSLEADLGPAFVPAFMDFATSTPPPAFGGPRADGWLFGRQLDLDRLSDHSRAELAVAGTEWRLWRGRLRRRRLALAVRMLRRARRLLVAVRAPGIGSRCVSLPLGPAPPPDV